jgi:SAM-dependent methyltransferase
MHLDVIDLRQFYYRTRLGRIAQKAIRDQMLTFWPEAKGQTVVGFGFAVPLLRPYLDDARRVVGLMPAEQGVMPWPSGLDNVSVLCREGLWPLETGHADKLVCLHGLETSEHPAAVLQECSRVLGPGGRALFIVPNRGGMWARRDKTPFGFRAALHAGPARGAAQAPRFRAGTPLRGAVRAAVGQTVLAQIGGHAGIVRKPSAGPARRRRPDRGGVQTGLRAAGSRPGGTRQTPIEGAGRCPRPCGRDRARSA